MALAGFYSKDGKKKNLSGFFINKIDVNTGKVTVSTTKDITAGMIGQNYSDDSNDKDDDDADKPKKEKKPGDDADDDDDKKCRCKSP